MSFRQVAERTASVFLVITVPAVVFLLLYASALACQLILH